MKTLIYLFLGIVIMLNFNCSDKETIGNQGEPSRYNIYFEMLKNDNSSFEEGSVEISQVMEMIDGELSYAGDNISWQSMKIDSLASDYLGRTIFEPLNFSSWSNEWHFQGQTDWELNFYYLLRYECSEIDTLRINDNTIVEPRRQQFDFLINEEHNKQIIITDEEEGLEEQPWVLTIQKEGF